MNYSEIVKGDWQLACAWIVGISSVRFQRCNATNIITVKSRHWPSPKFAPFVPTNDNKPYRSLNIYPPGSEAQVLIRAAAIDDGVSAPVLADWLYEFYESHGLTPESWERFVETVRQCRPENTASAIHAAEKMKADFGRSATAALLTLSADLHSAPPPPRPGHRRRARPGSAG